MTFGHGELNIPLAGKREAGGWSVVCAACKWERFEHARPLLDKAAREHQGKCKGAAQ